MQKIKTLEPQPISTDVLIEKYAKNNETTQEEIYRRVARGIASAEITEELRSKYEEIFYQNLNDGGIGGGRIMAAAGTDVQATLINCFVISVGDSIEGVDEDGLPGIYESVRLAACTMRRGGGVGYNFSKIRPKGSDVKSVKSTASGPCSYIDVFDTSCSTIESAGCFTGDALINTTEGLFKIKDIVESSKDFYAVTHAGPKKITAKFRNGIKPIIQVFTKYGFSVKVTADHKFAQFENGQIITRRIADIANSENQNLLLSIPLTAKLTPKQDDDEFFAYFLGAFHGNGCWRKDQKGTIKGVSISNNITKYDVVENIAFKMGNIGFKGNINKRPNENTIDLTYFDTEFFAALEKRGVIKGEMVIPSFILENTPEIRAAYLAGLFDTDGHFSENKSNIRLRMISYELLQQVQITLASLGVMSKLSVEREAVGNWKRIFNVGIYGKYAQEAFNRTVGCFTAQKLYNTSSRDRVGFSHSWDDVKEFGHYKSEFENYWDGNEYKHPNISMNAITNTIRTPELTNTVSDSVWFIKKLSEEETYDLEVEDVHLLSGNGIYTSNSRRGAQIGILNINHPDILEFVKAKRKEGRWNNFNVSVLVPDWFMEKINTEEEIELIHKAKPGKAQIQNGAYQKENGIWVYGKIKAKELWNIIMQSNYDYAEPGILFEDNINKDNNLRYVEYIDATNPCAEEPLPPNGCCDLGPIILPKFVKNPFSKEATFDFEKLEKVVRTQVRFLDNVLDATMWPLKEQHIESCNKRRIGIGFTGLGNTLAMMNSVYYAEEGLTLASKIAEVMRNVAYNESVNLAIEKGAFPLFDADKYLEEGTFASRLPEKIKERIRQHGIRNSHLLSIAPTGTVSLAFADNASNGIEPPFSFAYTRKKRVPEGFKYYNVLDHSFRVWLSIQEDQCFAKAIEEAVCNYQDKVIYNEKEYSIKDILPKSMVTALEMTAEQHLSMMRVVQPFIDSSVSKTVNVAADYPFEDFKNIYEKAWKFNLKGVSTYRPNNILGSVLSVEKPKETEVKSIVVENNTDTDNGKTIEDIVKEMYAERFESRNDGELPGHSIKGRFFTNQGEQKFLLTINYIEIQRQTNYGLITIQRPVEFLLTANFTANGSVWDAAMRFMSLMGRSGVPMNKIIENLKEITWEHGPVRYGTFLKNGNLVPIWHSSDTAVIGYVIENTLKNKGYLDDNGLPIHKYTLTTGETVEKVEPVEPIETKSDTSIEKQTGYKYTDKPIGTKCDQCGAYAVIKRDGCSFCEACGNVGSCG